MTANKLKNTWKEFSKEIEGVFEIPLETHSLKLQVTKQTDYGKQIISGIDLWGTSSIKDPSVIMTSIYSTIPNTKNKSLTITKPNILLSISNWFFGYGHILPNPKTSSKMWIKSNNPVITQQVKNILLRKDFDYPGLYVFLNRKKKALVVSVPHLIEEKKKLNSLLNFNNQIFDIINKN